MFLLYNRTLFCSFCPRSGPTTYTMCSKHSIPSFSCIKNLGISRFSAEPQFSKTNTEPEKRISLNPGNCSLLRCSDVPALRCSWVHSSGTVVAGLQRLGTSLIGHFITVMAALVLFVIDNVVAVV